MVISIGLSGPTIGQPNDFIISFPNWSHKLWRSMVYFIELAWWTGIWTYFERVLSLQRCCLLDILLLVVSIMSSLVNFTVVFNRVVLTSSDVGESICTMPSGERGERASGAGAAATPAPPATATTHQRAHHICNKPSYHTRELKLQIARDLKLSINDFEWYPWVLYSWISFKMCDEMICHTADKCLYR